MQLDSRLLMTIMTLSVMLSSCENSITDSFIDSGREKVISAHNTAGTAPDMLRIRLSPDMSESFIGAIDTEGYVAEEVLEQLGFPHEWVRVRTTFHIGGEFIEIQKKAGLDRWFDVISEQGPVETKAGNKIGDIPGIEFTEPVYIPARTDEYMNDPLLSAQWQFKNVGRYNFKAGVDIRLDEAWDRYGIYGNEHVIVAVVDGGIDCAHEDLSDNLWVNAAEATGTDGIDDDGNGYIDDVHGYDFISNKGTVSPDDHGTHVAGVISAVNNNELGISSIAGGRYPDKGVRLMSLESIDGQSGINIERVFQYAAENGAVICQNSWGYTDAKSLPQSAKVAIDYFISTAGKDPDGNQIGPMNGGLVIFAAGNESVDFGYPAMYEPCIAVSAIGPTGKHAYYTSYGDWVDVCAPGGDLQFDAIRGGVYSTLSNNTYGVMQGTSMACPQVSGLAALLVSEFGGPGFTPDRLRQIIEDSCDPNIYQYNSSMTGMLGKGMIDVVNAIASFSTIAPEPVSDHSLDVVSNFAHFRIAVPEDPDDGIARTINIEFAKVEDGVTALNHSAPVDTSYYDTDGMLPVSVKGLDFETEYVYRISASDFAGNVSTFTSDAFFKTGTNNPPIIEAGDGLDVIRVNSTSVETRTIEVTDPDGHTLTVSINTEAPAGVTCVPSSGGFVLKVDGSEIPDGEYQCELVFKDEYGASSSLEVLIKAGNSAPALLKQIQDLYINGVGKVVELKYDDYFSDDDGESLKLSFNIEHSDICDAEQSSGVMSFTSTGVGMTKITVTAADSAGKKVSSSFNMSVRDDSKPFDLYPNPAVDHINIRTGQKQEYEVAIYNATGRKILNHRSTISMQAVLTLDLKSLPMGNYIVRINGADGFDASGRFVKL